MMKRKKIIKMELPFGIIVRLSECVWTPTLRVTFIQELKHSSMHVVLSWFLVVMIHRDWLDLSNTD